MSATTLILIALGLIAALDYQLRHAGDDTPSWIASGVKTASTAALALAGISAGAPTWIIAGLALGSAGDFALSRPSTSAFLAGMAAFAAGHIAYVIAFVQMYPGGPVPWLVTPVMFAMIALVLLTVLWIAPMAGALCRPVRLYALVIAAMALTAAALPATDRMIQLGVLAFVASDLILAFRLFVLKDESRRLIAARTLWPLYWGGQALILWGAAG